MFPQMVSLARPMRQTRWPLLLLFGFSIASGQNIQTIAGGGPQNQPALTTTVPCPYNGCRMAVDSAGNLFVAVPTAGQVWKIDTSGVVNVVSAGAFNTPASLAFDSAGNLYVADANAYQIRRIAPGGSVSTVAGNGNKGFFGDGGPATSASFVGLASIAIDSSNKIFIGDGHAFPSFPMGYDEGQRIRVIGTNGNISTIAGKATSTPSGDGGPADVAGLSYPKSIALDSSGALYIAQNCSVRKIAAGVISTVAGTGACGYSGDGTTATSAQVTPVAIAIDRFNNLYILQGTAVRRIAAGQSNIDTVAGGAVPGTSGNGGSALAATFQNLVSIAIDNVSGAYYLANQDGIIRKVSGGVVTGFAGTIPRDYANASEVATDVLLETPDLLAADALGNLFFTPRNRNEIKKLRLGTGILTTASGNGTYQSRADGSPFAGSIAGVYSLQFDAAGNLYFLESGSFDGLHLRNVSGGVLSTVGIVPVISGGVYASALAANGDFYFSYNFDSQVHLLNSQTGQISIVAGNGTFGYSGDGGLALNASFNVPSALALDGAGNLFINDGIRIRKVSLRTNIVTTVSGTGGTAGLFADESSNLFFGTSSSIMKITAATGLLSTVVGNGVSGFSGDGGPATQASISPRGFTIDRSQNLYIGDASGRIRKTQVSACFFTLGTPTVYMGRLGGTGSVAITATNSDCPYSITSSLPSVSITSGASGTGSGTVTFSVTPDTGPNRSATVSVGGASFSVVQAGAMGAQNVGFFQPNAGPLWVLDSNGSGQYESSDKTFAFAGQAGAVALAGDWNGDGRTKVGYYLDGFWVLDYNGNGVYDGTGPGGDKFYGFGGAGSTFVPVTGDWNGDGRTKIGFYRNGFWALDTNGDGTFNAGDGFFGFGGRGPGEVPVIGDWNGDGRAKIGVFYQGLWILDYDGNGTFGGQDKYYASFPYAAGDKPVVGDWNGDGKTKMGIYRGGFWILDYNNNGVYDGVGPGNDKFYAFGGSPGEVPLVADWNGTGTSKVGVYNNGFWILDYNGTGAYEGVGPGGDRVVAFGGSPGNQPIVGRW